jgi:hypothetical protein
LGAENVGYEKKKNSMQGEASQFVFLEQYYWRRGKTHAGFSLKMFGEETFWEMKVYIQEDNINSQYWRNTL